MRYQRDEGDEVADAVAQLLAETDGIDFTLRDIDANRCMGEAEGEPETVAFWEAVRKAFIDACIKRGEI